MKFHSRLKATIESTTHNSTSPHDAVMATQSARHDFAKFSYPSSRSAVVFFFILVCLFRHLVFYCYYFCNNHTQTHRGLHSLQRCAGDFFYSHRFQAAEMRHTHTKEIRKPGLLLCRHLLAKRGLNYFFCLIFYCPKQGIALSHPADIPRTTPYFNCVEREERERAKKNGEKSYYGEQRVSTYRRSHFLAHQERRQKRREKERGNTHKGPSFFARSRTREHAMGLVVL